MNTFPLFSTVNTPEMESVAIEVMRSGRIASGSFVTEFESGLVNKLGQQNIVSTIDMTSAIHLALYLAGVRAGDHVLTTAFACMSTNSPIASMGARPIWVDMAANAAYIDVADFEAAITPETKAAIIYHLSGYPGPANEIAAICKRRGIFLIEDCDNAFLATINDVNVGSFGDFAVYSFYPTRQINTLEGGALVCKNPAHALQAKKLRRFGIDATSFRDSTGEINAESNIPEAGWSIGLNNFCSALGCSQLESVDARVQKSRANALMLEKKFSLIPELHLLRQLPNTLSSFWTFLVQAECRDEILVQLKAHGILASKLHQRNDVYSCFISSPRDLPNTAELQRTVLAIPCGWWLSSNDIEYIADVMERVITNISPARYKVGV